MYINVAKCVFEASTVNYLGYQADEDELKSLPEKVTEIRDYEEPTPLLKPKRFLGIVDFYMHHLPRAPYEQASLYRLLAESKKGDFNFLDFRAETS